MPFLYRYFGSKAATKTLDSGCLRIGRLESLNDPFDCYPQVISKYRRKADLCRLVEKTIFGKRDRELGILCFSRAWNNPLMWSHYADAHKGMAFVFWKSPTEDLLEIRYRKARPLVDADRIAAGIAGEEVSAFLTSLSTKPCCWKYEQEMRLIVKLNDCDVDAGNFFVPIPREMFRGVILGLKCEISELYVRRAIQKLGFAEAKIWKVQKHTSNFSLTREQLSL